MPKASRRAPSHQKVDNPPIASLTIDEASAALNAMANGRAEMPPLAELRGIVQRRLKPQAVRKSPPLPRTRTICILAVLAFADGEVQSYV